MDESLSQNTLTVIALTVLAVVFLGLLWSVFRRPRRPVTAFKAENGAVTISRKALEDVIARTCETFPEIIRAKVHVTHSSHKLKTRIQLHLRQSARIRDFSDRLRAEIATILTENLGMDEVGTIELLVAGIAADKRRKHPESDLQSPATDKE